MQTRPSNPKQGGYVQGWNDTREDNPPIPSCRNRRWYGGKGVMAWMGISVEHGFFFQFTGLLKSDLIQHVTLLVAAQVLTPLPRRKIRIWMTAFLLPKPKKKLMAYTERYPGHGTSTLLSYFLSFLVAHGPFTHSGGRRTPRRCACCPLHPPSPPFFVCSSCYNVLPVAVH